MRHPKNKTRYKSLDKVAADPRVLEIYDEDSDGIWVNLAPGFNWDGCSAVHERSARAIINAMSNVKTGNPY